VKMKQEDVSVNEAIRQAQIDQLQEDENALILGLNAASPLGIFGTVAGLVEQFGAHRVIETPASEAALTGIALGMATAGMRPILIHQRFDFSLLGIDQLVNQVAKWHFMYGGKLRAPLTVRVIVGRGWGQGPQHSQALHAWLAHVPGLQVVMSSFPQDSYDALRFVTTNDVPTIFVEHRWVHYVRGSLEKRQSHHLQKFAVRRVGSDVTLVGTSYMVIECIAAAKLLETRGISAEVVDQMLISPLDISGVASSASKTGRLVVADIGTKSFGVGAEIVSRLVEGGLILRTAPVRIGLPDMPTPTAVTLASHFYPTATDIANAALTACGYGESSRFVEARNAIELDSPNQQFLGPY
jgi:pyruvate/2-oxoglutarate/acetoin dehydrogenase E1 component